MKTDKHRCIQKYTTELWTIKNKPMEHVEHAKHNWRVHTCFPFLSDAKLDLNILISSSEECFAVARLLWVLPLVFGWHDLDVVLDEAVEVLFVGFFSGTKSSSSSVDDKPMIWVFLEASFLDSVYKK